LKEEFNHVVEEMGLMDDDGLTCYMENHLNDSSDDHDHDHDHDHDDHDAIDDHDNATNCSTIYKVCRNLILEIGLTTEACLDGTNARHDDDDDDDDVSSSQGWQILNTV